MEQEQLSGTLLEWNDARGFGFIQHKAGARKVFVHISDLEKAIRRPQVGDRVSFFLSTQTEGKPRAVQACLIGVPPEVKYVASKPASHPFSGVKFFLGAGLLIFLFGSPLKNFLSKPTTMSVSSPMSSTTSFGDDAPQSDSFAPPGHTIKGNISVGTGRRLYHTPGCEDYNETVIDLARGECWFRTPSEAKASGWADAHRP